MIQTIKSDEIIELQEGPGHLSGSDLLIFQMKYPESFVQVCFCCCVVFLELQCPLRRWDQCYNGPSATGM